MNPTTIYNIVSLISAVFLAWQIHRYLAKQRRITAQLYTAILNQQIVIESLYIPPTTREYLNKNSTIIESLHKQLIIDADD